MAALEDGERMQLLEGSERVSLSSFWARKALFLGASLLGVVFVIGALRSQQNDTTRSTALTEAATRARAVAGDEGQTQDAVEAKGEDDHKEERKHSDDDDDDGNEENDGGDNGNDGNDGGDDGNDGGDDVDLADDDDGIDDDDGGKDSVDGTTTAPHIVYILADDLGWNDIGYQSTDLLGFSPTLDALAAKGVKLSNFYGLHQCTPARSALMTGIYPIHTGMCVAKEVLRRADELLIPTVRETHAGRARGRGLGRRGCVRHARVVVPRDDVADRAAVRGRPVDLLPHASPPTSRAAGGGGPTGAARARRSFVRSFIRSFVPPACAPPVRRARSGVYSISAGTTARSSPSSRGRCRSSAHAAARVATRPLLVRCWLFRCSHRPDPRCDSVLSLFAAHRPDP